MKKIILALDAFDPNTWTEYEAEDVRDFLTTQFSIFPENARIYHKDVASVCDVTPWDDNSIELLGQLEGPFIVVLYPGDAFTWVAVITAVIALATTVYTYLSMPNVANKSQQSPSSSNTLSDRQNTARPKSRIPDIYGEVLSTPDLLSVPYTVFENNIQVEYTFLCLGRGSYDVDTATMYDGDTLLTSIDGCCAAVYAPGTIPLHGTPQAQIGASIYQGVTDVSKSNAVNGQILHAPNYKQILSGSYTAMNFEANNSVGGIMRLIVDYTTDIPVEYIFDVGDIVEITGASAVTDGTHTVNLDGIYTVYQTNAGADSVWLTPANGSSELTATTYLYNNFASHKSPATITSVSVAVDATREIGPITITIPIAGQLMINLVALQGIYLMDGGNQDAWEVSFEISVQPLNSSGVPVGSPHVTTETMKGSKIDRSIVGSTFIAGAGVLIAPLDVAVTIKRTTSSLYDGKTYVDEVQWRDMYATAVVPQTTFGDITTMQVRTVATPSALGVKERKINLLVTRKVPARIGTTSTFGALTASKSAADIICAIALDQHIGNRDISEIDIANIYDTITAINTYFGITEASEFCYTFDDNQITFEETVKIIANAVFCDAYRQGHITKLFFEKANENSMLLFNHRNKIPGSETRNVRFGTPDNCDGIELTYVNPSDESEVTYYIPEDKSAVKPQTIKTVGVRNDKQAYLLAYRAWNKLRYQNISTEFTATQEANVLVRNNRVLVTDNTRQDTQDGEILSQNVLELTLSQPFEYTTLDHTIFLQMYDGTVQAIEIASAEPSPTRTITLSEPPNLPLSLDYSLARRTTYVIIKNDDTLGHAFLIDTKTPQDITKCQISAINYNTRYYDNDKDFA